jgi:hypothetical protein
MAGTRSTQVALAAIATEMAVEMEMEMEMGSSTKPTGPTPAPMAALSKKPLPSKCRDVGATDSRLAGFNTSLI